MVLTFLWGQTTKLESKLIDYLAKDDKVGCSKWGRCYYCANKPAVKMFLGHSGSFFRMNTRCISKGVKRLGLRLDHNLALHPNTSKVPAKATVGSIQHNL
jgi:hypothetical protein